jgi:apolipoprotein N-acyltransferase
LAYAKLRAIETRRWVARSANTGISAVINEYGNIVNSKPWNTPAVIKYNIPQKSMLTFYVKHGDYLYQIFSLIGVLFLLWNWVLLIQKRFFKKNLIA